MKLCSVNVAELNLKVLRFKNSSTARVMLLNLLTSYFILNGSIIKALHIPTRGRLSSV